MVRPILLAALACTALACAACAPTTTYNGFQARDEKPADVKVGVDTKSTILARLGSPTTQTAFGGDAWYYLTQITEREAYYKPKVRSRDVVAITFDKEDKVASVKTLHLQDGYQIAYDRRQTPTRGRDLSILEQIVGTLGRTAVLPQDDDPGRTRPR
jgi:outer membrane protein assembly factor BamE (lipoprotein component of BamABCDE complex)